MSADASTVAPVSLDRSAISEIGRRAGLCAVGFCRAEPFSRTAETLHDRKRAGLHGGMQFTYRNPQRSTEPQRLVPGAASLVVGALDFSEPACDRPDDFSPYARVAAYARADYYTPLKRALEAIAGALRAHGHRAVVSADSNGLVDRAAAHRAGIGWWGKNSNILVPGAGSLVVLGAVVTDAALVSADPEPMADGCGTCRQCLDGCPTGAIVTAGTVDARRCLAWLVQADGVFDPDHRIALGDRLYGCDDCSDVCPPNRIHLRRRAHANGASPPQPPATEGSDASSPVADAAPSAEQPPAATDSDDRQATAATTSDDRRPTTAIGPDAAPPTVTTGHIPRPRTAATGSGVAQTWVAVLDVLDASDEELIARFGRWYIPRRQARYLRRNALVVLANVGRPDDPRTRTAVERSLRDPDPLIRAHAVWCARRLELGLDALTGRDDPMVKAELDRPVPPIHRAVA